MRLNVFLVVLFVIWLSPLASSSDTSMFRSDPQHTGVYQTTAIVQFTRVKWKLHTQGYVVSTPAVANGMVYVGSTDGNLYAVDRNSGALRWKYKTMSRVVSSPAVANGLVYFNSYDGYFYALNAHNGRLQWRFHTGGEHRFEGTHLHGSQPAAETMPDPFDVFLSSPTLSNGAVYFGSGDGNVYSLNAMTGALDWKFQTGNVVHASPAIASGTLYVGSWDSYFYALDATSGKERWRFKTGEDPEIHNQVGIQSSAAVQGDTVYFGCRDSHLYALDARSGAKRWSFPTGASWVVASPAVQDGKVFFATSDSGLFYALDARTGATIFSLSFHGWPTFSSPVIAGNMLYVGSNAGRLNAIDLQHKRIAWTFTTDGARRYGSTYTNPDGTPNYAVAFESDFYDDLVVGATKMLSVGAILSSPVSDDHVIYVGSTDGNLYALV